MYKFIISSLVLSLQVSIMQTCSRSLVKRSLNEQYANQPVQPIGTTSSSNMISNHSVRFDNEFEPIHTARYTQHQQKLDESDLQFNDSRKSNFSEYISDNELTSLRVEYYKYKILSNLGINKDPDNLAPSGYERLAQLEANRHLISDIERTDSTQRSKNQRRGKRSLACRDVQSNQDACCMQDFYLNFTDFGWDKWIIYPSGYMANYCRGKCDLSHARYHHSKLLMKYNHIVGLCCSPRRMAPLQLLYIDDNKVHQKAIPDMIVESCDCA